MNDDRIETLLLQLVSDVAVIKSRLDNVDEIRETLKELGTRVDHLEAQNSRHEYELKALENRANKMEEWTRNSMADSNKTHKSTLISAGLAIFGAIVSLVFNML